MIRFFGFVLSNALWDFLKISFGVVFSAFFSGLISKFLIVYFTFLKELQIWIILTFCSGGIFLFFIIYERLSRFHPKFPRLHFDYIVERRELSYEFKDLYNMTYTRTVHLQALRNSLDSYRDKYFWTGKGNVNVRSAIPEHEFRETNRKSCWNHYEIAFNKVLAKKDPIETEIVWNLADTEKQAVPFFGCTIDEPTNVLKFNLSIPKELQVNQVTCEISCGIGSKSSLKSFTKNFDRNGKVSWEIINPKLLYYYEMKWVINS